MRPIRVLFCFIAVLACATACAFALEINVGPDTLVLSSNVRHITVHSDYPYSQVNTQKTVVTVKGNDVKVDAQWANSIGNLMVRCSKKAVKDAVGDFDGATTTAKVTLIVTPKVGFEVYDASDTIVVKK